MRGKYDWNDPTHQRLYRIWSGMKSRCKAKPGERWYSTYSSRGIRVCDEWAKDFSKFRDWSLSHGYKSNLSIDRIDNNKGYSPDNCRWATFFQQLNNKQFNVKLTYNGVTHTLSEWGEIINKPAATIYRRKCKGWSDSEALTIPKRMGRNYQDMLGRDELCSIVDECIAAGACINKNDFIKKVGISRSVFFYTYKHERRMSKENTYKIRAFYSKAKEEKK